MAKRNRYRLVYRKENDPNSGLGILDMELDGRYFIAYHDNPSKAERESLVKLVRLANKASKVKSRVSRYVREDKR